MDDKRTLYNKRTVILGLGITIIFILLLLRLFYLQYVKSDEFLAGALNQRGQEIFMSPERGIIYDRNNIPLTNNKKVPTLIVHRRDLLKNEALYNEIKNYTLLSSREFNNRLDSQERLLLFPMKEEFKLEDKRNNLFLIDIVNRYNDRNLLSHVIGYINKSDNRGESGIEKVFDEYLNIDAMEFFIIEYDKSRNMILDGTYQANENIDPYNPSGVKLTIDKSIQEKVESIIDFYRLNGSIVVADVDSSEILAMVSRPNFDQDNIQRYFDHMNMNLYNKAIQVGYPPGSIFKIVVLLTALEEYPELIEDEYYCDGYEEINGVKIKCSGRHGYLSLEDGFTKSCNSVFIQLAQQVGAEEIIEMAKRLGFGEKINIGLLEETAGNLPKDNELLGAAVGNIAIGQGEIEVTPLQISNMMMTIVNGGVNKPLSLIKGITNHEGFILKEYNQGEERRIISQKASIKVMNMLRQVVVSGTGRYIELEDIGGSAGKTGSAEGIFNQERIVQGWFTGYYPYKNPRYVITIIIEDAESGSKTAAPIFQEIIEEIEKRGT